MPDQTMRVIYKITYPNGKIYVGMDMNDTGPPPSTHRLAMRGWLTQKVQGLFITSSVSRDVQPLVRVDRVEQSRQLPSGGNTERKSNTYL
jgi:hypothetical protein